MNLRLCSNNLPGVLSPAFRRLCRDARRKSRLKTGLKIRVDKLENMQQTPIQVGEYSFTIIVEPNDPDGYLVTCPSLPGLVTQGDTLDEAYEMAQDAIQVYLESLIADGEPIPRDKITMPVRVKIDNDKIAA